MRLAARAAFMALALAACGDAKPRAAAPIAPRGAEWQDAFDRVPTLLAVVHPRALQRDKIYGPLLRRLSQLAATRSAAVAATRTLEAFESCDEILATMDEDGTGALVLRGVRADIDPGRLVDDHGVALWRTEMGAKVPEYVHDEGGTTASLFVLPARTWFIATGDGRARAREAFVHPSGRPKLRYDADALVSVRIYGPALLRHVRQLRKSGPLEALGAHLDWATIALAPGADGALVLGLAYKDEESAALAEVSAKHVVQVLRDRDVQRFRWLFAANVARDDAKVVTVRAPLPPALLDGLAKASDARDLDDPELPSP